MDHHTPGRDHVRDQSFARRVGGISCDWKVGPQDAEDRSRRQRLHWMNLHASVMSVCRSTLVFSSFPGFSAHALVLERDQAFGKRLVLDERKIALRESTGE